MASNNTFDIYLDPDLTYRSSSGVRGIYALKADGTSGDVDHVFYFGSRDATRKCVNPDGPGTLPLTFYAYSVPDVNPANNQPTTIMKVSDSQLGLDTATETFDFPATVYGGAGNAVEVWVRMNSDDGVTTAYSFKNLRLRCDAAADVAA